MPEISVVLPVFNGERYLREAVDSVIMQTCKSWELIVVDDGSVDSSVDIIKDYMSRDNRIRLIKNEDNLGLPLSLNKGFDNAKGKYFTWTSDDNVYLNTAFEEMKDYLDTHTDMYMVAANEVFFGGRTEMIISYNQKSMPFCNSVGACFLYRCGVVSEVGKYDDGWRLIEDYEYWLRILERYGEIGHIDKILYRYREHDQSLTSMKRHNIDILTYKLSLEHMSYFVETYRSNTDVTMRIYYRSIECGIDVDYVREKVGVVLPKIKMDVGHEDGRRFIIYGAGEFGHEVRKYLREKAYCYADSDPMKIGGKKDGLDIISIDEACRLKRAFHIVVAVNYPIAYQVIENLVGKGVSDYVSFPRLMKWKTYSISEEKMKIM